MSEFVGVGGDEVRQSIYCAEVCLYVERDDHWWEFSDEGVNAVEFGAGWFAEDGMLECGGSVQVGDLDEWW